MSLRRETKDNHPHQLICDICYVHYNRTNRQPLIICQHDHLVCSYCIRLIRKNKKCPFCRIPIDLDKIRIDYVTMSKLTPDPQQPNIRYQKQQPEYFQLTPEPSESSQDSHLLQEGLIMEFQDWQLQRMYLVEQTARKRALIYITTIFLVLPFAATDIFFGYFYKDQPNCTDIPHLFSFLTISTWMRFIGGVQALYLLIFLLSIIKRKCSNGQYQSLYLNRLQEIYGIGLIIKSVICSIVELIIFFVLNSPNCKGQIYGYGLALTCLHIMKITMVAMSLVRNWCC